MEQYDQEMWNKLKSLNRDSFSALPLPGVSDMMYALIQKVKELEGQTSEK